MDKYSYEITLLTKCLGYLAGTSDTASLIEMLEVLSRSQYARNVINEIKTRIHEFDRKIAENDLTTAEKTIIAGCLHSIIEGYKNEKIENDQKDNEAVAATRSFEENVPLVSREERVQSKEAFVNSLVTNWIKQTKDQSLSGKEQILETQIKNRISKQEKSGTIVSPSEIIRITKEEIVRVDKTFNEASFSIAPSIVKEKYSEAYRSVRLRTEFARSISADVPLTVPLDLYGAALLSSNPETKHLREEAEAVARVATAVSSDGYLAEVLPPRLVERFGLPENSTQQIAVVSDAMQQQITLLVNSRAVEKVLGSEFASSALASMIRQSSATSFSRGAPSISKLVNIVSDITSPIIRGFPEDEQQTAGFLMFIRGIEVARATNRISKSSPFYVFNKRNVGKEEILFKLWALTASEEQVSAFKTVLQQKEPHPIFERILGENGSVTEGILSVVSELRSGRESTSLFSLYLSQLFGTRGPEQFTSLTGLEFLGSAFRIATGRPKQAELAFLMKSAGATVGKSALSRLAILSKAIPGPVGWLALGLGAVSGLLKGLFGGGQKGKTSEDIYKIIFVVIGIIALLFATGFTNSPQQNFSGQLVDSLGGASSLVQPGFAPCQGDACLWPLVQACGCLTQGVGGTYSHRTTSGQLYNAIDIGFSGCSSLSPQIRPTHSGFVSRVQNSNTGYGLAVYVTDLSGRYQTIYAHLSSIAVAVGQQVTPETTLGLGGSTGNSDGPHLHYERRDGPPFRIGVGTSIMSTIPSSFAGYCPGYGVNGGI